MPLLIVLCIMKSKELEEIVSVSQIMFVPLSHVRKLQSDSVQYKSGYSVIVVRVSILRFPQVD